MISRFSCHNFRNIQADALEFEKINILIGPNNSGKSNFIKAITFFSEMLKNAGKGSLKSAFLDAVARNGWDHSLYKHAEENTPIDFAWDICLNGEPVRYKFSFVVGESPEKCNIWLEELNAVELKERYDKEFNYFRCHDSKFGQGFFSTAIKTGTRNRRLSFAVDSKETLIMQFKDILLKNQSIYGNELIRVNIAQLLYELQKYFEGFRRSQGRCKTALVLPFKTTGSLRRWAHTGCRDNIPALPPCRYPSGGPGPCPPCARAPDWGCAAPLPACRHP